MVAIRAHYDGKEVHLPDDVKGLRAGEVIVLFEEGRSPVDDGWLKAQEQALARAWDDKEDSVYGTLRHGLRETEWKLSDAGVRVPKS